MPPQCDRSFLRTTLALIVGGLLSGFSPVHAAANRSLSRPNRPKPDESLSLERLVEKVKPSVAVITHFDRDGKVDVLPPEFTDDALALSFADRHADKSGN